MYVLLSMLNGDGIVSEHDIGLIIQLLQGLHFRSEPVATSDER